jgi:hypothetical protein
MNAAAKHNPQPEVIPLILPRSGHDRIQLGQKLQVVGMLLHLAFVRTQSFGEDELIAVACSFPAMSDIALMDGNCANDVVAFVDGCRDCQSFSSGVGEELVELFAVSVVHVLDIRRVGPIRGLLRRFRGVCDEFCADGVTPATSSPGAIGDSVPLVQNICDFQACSIVVVIHAKEADDSFNFQPPFFFAEAFSAGIFLAILTVHEQFIFPARPGLRHSSIRYPANNWPQCRPSRE